MEISILPTEPVTLLKSTKFLVIRCASSHILVGISMLVIGLIIYVINMASWMRNIPPVTATCEIIVDRLPSLSEIEVERHRRKKAEEEETKEQQQDDDDYYDTVSKIKLINGRKSIKEFRVTGNLNGANAGRIIAEISQALRCGQK